MRKSLGTVFARGTYYCVGGARRGTKSCSPSLASKAPSRACAASMASVAQKPAKRAKTIDAFFAAKPLKPSLGVAVSMTMQAASFAKTQSALLLGRGLSRTHNPTRVTWLPRFPSQPRVTVQVHCMTSDAAGDVDPDSAAAVEDARPLPAPAADAAAAAGGVAAASASPRKRRASSGSADSPRKRSGAEAAAQDAGAASEPAVGPEGAAGQQAAGSGPAAAAAAAATAVAGDELPGAEAAAVADGLTPAQRAQVGREACVTPCVITNNAHYAWSMIASLPPKPFASHPRPPPGPPPACGALLRPGPHSSHPLTIAPTS